MPGQHYFNRVTGEQLLEAYRKMFSSDRREAGNAA
jgi:hypothetical protein